jgi:small GTP-binding protein
MSKEYDAKLILVGETNVGKTSLLRQYVDHLFSEEKVTTIGYDTMHKELELPEGKISLQIWDTCGQEQFRTVNQLFVKNSKMALLVYDITNYKTFEELKNFWYSYVTSAVGKEIIFGIAGNKSDLYENEQVKVSDAQQFANEIGAVFKETTAKNYEAITSLIEEMSSKYIQQSSNENKNENENEKIVIGKSKSKNKDRCCNRRRD